MPGLAQAEESEEFQVDLATPHFARFGALPLETSELNGCESTLLGSRLPTPARSSQSAERAMSFAVHCLESVWKLAQASRKQ